MTITGSLEQWIAHAYRDRSPILYTVTLDRVNTCWHKGHLWKFNPNPTEAEFLSQEPYATKVDNLAP